MQKISRRCFGSIATVFGLPFERKKRKKIQFLPAEPINRALRIHIGKYETSDWIPSSRNLELSHVKEVAEKKL